MRAAFNIAADGISLPIRSLLSRCRNLPQKKES